MHYDNKTYYEVMDMPTDIRIDYIRFVEKEKQLQKETLENNKKDMMGESINNKDITNPNIK